MSQLPFLVEHGASVWKLALVGLTAGSVALVTTVRDLRARRAARARVTAWNGEVTAVAAGQACVRGTLRGGTLSSLIDRELARDHVEGAPWVEGDDGTRIELAGRARVIEGGVEARSRVGVPRGTPAAIADRRGRWVLRTVGDGDEVIVRGIAHAVPDRDASYREGVAVWRLEAVEVLAVRPRAIAPHLSWVPQLLLLCAVGGLWFGLMHHIGARAAARLATEPELDHLPGSTHLPGITAFGDLAIACAMPGSCDDAIDAERRWYFDRYGRRGSAFAQYDALMRDQPCALTREQVRALRLDDALVSARACGDRDLEARVQVLLGNAAAALALAPGDARTRELAAVGAGDWRAASAAASQVSRLETTLGFGRDAATARCRAAWYLHLAGDPNALRAVAMGSAECEIYRALAAAPAAQAQQLATIARDAPDSELWARTDARVLASLAGVDDSSSSSPASCDAIFGPTARKWLAPFSDPSAPTQPCWAPQGRAVSAALRGDFAGARAAADAITDEGVRDGTRLWIALREGSELPKLGEPDLAFPRAVAAREGRPFDPDLRGVDPHTCAPIWKQAIERAVAGDGTALARVYAGCHVFYFPGSMTLFGIIPRITEGRAELADALRAFRGWPPPDDDRFALIDQLADYRDLARLAGDDEEAARLQSVIDRHARVLADRDRALALYLLSR